MIESQSPKKTYNQFTVIIPEHNRPERLKRLLEFFLSFHINIIVVDSSDAEFKYLSTFESLITYRYFRRLDLAAKLSKIIDLIPTPYVVMCANDDFLVPETINKIITFLESNEQYNSGQGVYTDFTPFEGNLKCSLRYIKTMSIDLNQERGADRLLCLQGNYFQYYYAVFRTVAFKEAIESVVVNGASLIKNLCLLESFISCYTAISGKHIILPIFYSARENIVDSAASSTPTIPSMIDKKDANSRIEMKNYLDILSTKLIGVDNLSSQEAGKIVNESLRLYVKSMSPNFYMWKGKAKRKVQSILSDKMIRFVSKLILRSTAKEPTPVPSDLKGWENWDMIEKQIIEYYYIYKK